MQENHNKLLQDAIEELKSSPTINIHGKSYTQVSTRVNIFRKYFPDATLETLITHHDDYRVIIQSKISIDNRIIATGYAEETRGDGNSINATSMVEVCETSAIGRALANYGLGGSEYASSFEVGNAIIQQDNLRYNATSNYPPNNQQQRTNQLQNYQNQNQPANTQTPLKRNTPNTQSSQKQYQYQNDFSELVNVGLSVVEDGDILVVVGDGIFEKKNLIRNAGFRWSAQNKVWYMQMRQAA